MQIIMEVNMMVLYIINALSKCVNRIMLMKVGCCYES